MKHNFKKLMALVIAAIMVMAMVVPTMAANPEYTITVKNTNQAVTINGKTYTAYKLFENTYDGDTTAYGLDQTPHAYYIKKGSPFFDAASVETETTNGITTYKLKSTLTDAQKKASPLAQILDYFVLTEMPGEAGKAAAEQLVLVQPKDSAGKILGDTGYDAATAFTATQAYEFAQKMAPILAAGNYDGWKAAATATSETVTIDTTTLGAGYYLVTGEGTAINAQEGAANGDTVTAAVALTTTDPTAEIIAKLDAPKVKKEINEQGTPKYNNKGVGDTVPYIVTSDVPNMTGYEKYFFIMSDTLSSGLTLNDDADLTNDNGTDEGFEVYIGTTKLTRVADHAAAVAADATNKQTYYIEKDPENNSFEVVFHDFIQYKGNLIVDDSATDPNAAEPFSTYDYRTLNVEKSKVGTLYSPWDGQAITIKYSATVNENAVIGESGNVNTSKLIYSNQPDKNNTGKPGDEDKPGYGEGFDNVTEESPESKTVTYVTGLKLLKYTGSEKSPLADAEFTLVGQDLRNLVKQSSVIYRAPKSGETADTYELTGGRYSKDNPTFDRIVDSNGTTVSGTTVPAYGRIIYGNYKDYAGYDPDNAQKVTVNLPDGTTTEIVVAATDINKTLIEDQITSYDYKRFRTAVSPADDSADKYVLNSDGTYTQDASGTYVIDSRDWNELTIAEKEAATVRQTVKTDENGIVLFRGLQDTGEGYYTLTEIKAPTGYNLLKQPVEIKVAWSTANAQDNNNVQDSDVCTWAISARKKGETTWTQLSKDDTYQTLFNLEVENNSGTELPSTGGIGTTLFYVIGAILVVGAGILLVTKRRMSAN